MAAAGARSALLPLPAQGSGPELALTTDALWARTRSDATHELAASDSDVTRLRLGLEGSVRFATEGSGHLTPKVEVGARHDGGDAETGFGIELGGGLAWSDPALGLSLDLSGRTLIAHDADALADRGFAASLGLRPESGERARSVSEPSPDPRRAGRGRARRAVHPRPAERAHRRRHDDKPLDGGSRLGPLRLLGALHRQPAPGPEPWRGARDYTLGWRLTPGTGAGAPELSLGVKATRRQSEGTAPEHAVGVELRTQW